MRIASTAEFAELAESVVLGVLCVLRG